MSIVARQSAASAGRAFDEEADAKSRKELEEQVEAESPGHVHERPRVRRRRHRPARHPHRARHRPCRQSTPTKCAAVAASAYSGCRSWRSPKLLVANRGEIAAPRHAHLLATMGIDTVAVYSDADADAPFVLEADEAVPLGGAAPASPTCAATRCWRPHGGRVPTRCTPATASCPRTRSFAQRVIDAGTDLGRPTARAIEAMGSKLAAARDDDRRGRAGGARRRSHRRETTTSSWPCGHCARLPGVGEGVVRRWRTGHAPRPRRRRTRRRGRVRARREAASAFGDDTVYLERYVETPRHIEIQIFGDTHGNVVAPLRARVLDPAPPPEDHRRGAVALCDAPSCAREMGDAAIAAARARRLRRRRHGRVHRRADGEFFFLEMNTRLQVEHPVTEMITGIDLVRLQLQVAAGEPLPAEVVRRHDDRTRHRGAAVRRGRRERTTCPRPGACTGSRAGGRRTARRRGIRRRATSSAPTTTRCWQRSSPTAATETRPRSRWPGRCGRPRSTASRPTGSCSSASCENDEFVAAPSTPTSWTVTPLAQLTAGPDDAEITRTHALVAALRRTGRDGAPTAPRASGPAVGLAHRAQRSVRRAAFAVGADTPRRRLSI